MNTLEELNSGERVPLTTGVSVGLVSLYTRYLQCRPLEKRALIISALRMVTCDRENVVNSLLLSVYIGGYITGADPRI